MVRGLWLIVGFLVATLLAATFEPLPAAAQGRQATDPSFSRGPSAPTRGRAGEPIVDDTETAPDIPAPIPADDPSQDPRELDDLDPRPRVGQRPVILDGDPNYPPEPPLARDGIVDVGEPDAAQDGIDPTAIDTREPEDIAAFENPPAGFDPLLFQIDDIDPILDRRPRRLFQFEPYDPIGIKAGSFVFFPEVETDLAFFSNLFRAPRARRDVAYEVKPSARLVSNWQRHALEFRAAGNLSFYNEFDSENDKGYVIEARGRLDVTRRTNVQALVSRELSQESRSALDASSAGDRADLVRDRANVTLTHRFNRLSLQLRGGITEYDYGGQANGAVFNSNDDRDYRETEEILRASWEFKPTLFGFAEVALNQRSYNAAATSDGIRRDSDGERYRIGVGFGNTGQKLRGEIAVGYGTQRPEDRRLAEIDGVILDANATWRVTPVTSFIVSARSDVTETTTSNVGGALSRQIGLEARHEFARNIIGTAGVGVTWQTSPGNEIDEREIRSTLGLEYFVNREVMLFSRYVNTVLDSNQPTSDYTNNELRVGMRVRR